MELFPIARKAAFSCTDLKRADKIVCTAIVLLDPDPCTASQAANMEPLSERESRAALARRNGDYDDPGATRMWFGKWKGKRLDKLTEKYRRWLLRTYREGPLARMVADVGEPPLGS